MNQNNTPRRSQRKVVHQARLPKSLTANAPFRVRKNKQLLSTPSHTTGLTIRRAVRFNVEHQSGLNQVTTYQNIFTKFLQELNVTLATPNGRLSFSPEWVNFYAVCDTYNNASLRIYDEPRASNLVNTFVNSPFFEASDSATNSGVISICAVIPKAATYTMSVDDSGPMKDLPFISFECEKLCRVIIDVGGTFSLKKTTGFVSGLQGLTLKK